LLQPAVEPSANVHVAHATLCNDLSVFIATFAYNCGCEFRPWQIRPVSAEPLAATRGTPVENHWLSTVLCEECKRGFNRQCQMNACPVYILYVERSAWKNQQRRARFYWKGAWSFRTRSQTFAALVLKWR